MSVVQPKKKILFIITKSNWGGAQRYVFDLALAMDKKDYEVAVGCGGEGELVDKLHSANIKTFVIKGFQRDISFFKEIQALFSLADIIRQFKPEVVHINSSKAGLLGSFVARLMSVPKIIFTAHGWPYLEARALWWRLMAWVGSYLTGIFSHHVILISNYDKKQTLMPGVRGKCSVIYNAILDIPFLSREESRNKLFNEETIKNHQHNIWLVTHGELNQNKNIAAAIDAVAEFNSTYTTKIFYSVLGTGELMNDLKEQADLKGLSDYIYFLGYIENASQYLLAFDIYIIPSKKEGVPYSLLEAGIAGLPCIASNVGGIPEVIINKETGLLINPNNHMSIVEALDFLLTNSDKRSKYSTVLSQHIKTNFSSYNMIEKTEGIYLL